MLKACVQPGSTVKRVILTVAVAGNMDIPKTYSEKDWSDLSKISAYPKSKTLAEKAA